MQSKKTMALYIRISVEDGDLRKSSDKAESNSISNQRKLLMDYYRTHQELSEYSLTEYCDDGYSGTNFKRPGFQEMLENVKRGRIQCILVKDLSRFGREYLEVGAYLELILPLFGTRFISVNDGFDSIRYIGTTGGMELALRNLINSMYSRDLSLKVRTSVKTRNRKGLYWGGPAFYGYQLAPENKHRLVVDESARPVVEKIFKLCIEGMSTMQIARVLNDMHIPCPAEHKRKAGDIYNGRVMEDSAIWIGGTVCKILHDERYTGKMISGTRESVGIRSNKMRVLPKEQWIVVEGAHEAIISQETYNAAAIALESRIRTVNDNTSGDRKNNHFVCGVCGRKLQKTNGKQLYLYCIKGRSDSTSACTGLRVEWNKLQETVVSVVKAHVRMLLDKTEKTITTKGAEKKLLTQELKRLERKLGVIKASKTSQYEAYKGGKYTKEQYVQLQMEAQIAMEELANRIVTNKELLKRAEKDIAIANKTHSAASGILPLEAYDPNIIRKLVEEVRVFDNCHIEVLFRNRDIYTTNEAPTETA